MNNPQTAAMTAADQRVPKTGSITLAMLKGSPTPLPGQGVILGPDGQSLVGADVNSSTGQDRTPKMLTPVYGLQIPTTSSIVAANRIYLARCVARAGGDVRDLTVWINAALGNAIAMVYDTGDAASGFRTLKWASASVAVAGSPATPGWMTIDPGAGACPVIAGQQIDLAWMFSSATTALGRGSSLIAGSAGQLPDAFLPAPGGALPKLAATFGASSFAAPATIANNSVVAASNLLTSMFARTA
jgi:hypothetical protein